MNILHILDGFHIGGVETQAYEIIRNLPKGNKSFLVNTFSEIKDMKDIFIKLNKSNKIQKIKDIKFKSPLLLILEIFFFAKKNKINKIIIYPSNKKMFFVVLGAKVAGIKNIFMSLQNTLYEKKSSTIFKIKILIYMLNTLGVFFVPASNAILDSYSKLKITLTKFKVIYNSCDWDSINFLSKKYKKFYLNKKIKTIVMIARLDNIKDQETLLKAFANLKESSWRLKIVGDGPNMNSLKNISRKLALNNEEEIFYGPSKNIPNILAGADIFAFSTTEAEGFGKVLIEAMAAKVPIIASDVSACREILFNGKGGVLVPPKDINEWTSILQELIKNEARRKKISENSFLLKDFFNSKNIANKWYKLLKN